MQFLDPVVSVMTPGDLGIPNSPPSAKDGQLYDVREGDQYLIYTADKRGCGHFNVLRWHEQNSGRKQVELQNMRANTHLYLDTWQIGHLERNGLIRPLVVAREG
ncbi:MAG: hypothetical protein IKD61_06910, partial [Oscillospiraceae bacterium]|nr:hypothetical protein [Oscillospiraceae bacterium]